MAKSGVLSQKVTKVMHGTTHADSPAHVVEGTPFTHEIPLDKYYGTGVIVDIPKKKWRKYSMAGSPATTCFLLTVLYDMKMWVVISPRL